jgi:putative DNA-invertase from lambdoid prophage Rac
VKALTLYLGGDVTGNGISKLVFTILSAVAEAERDRMRERVSQVKADQRGRGRYLGGKVPFGFTVGPDGALVPVPSQRTAKQAREAGATMRDVQSLLEQQGHKLALAAVHRVLTEGRAS